MRLSHLNLKKLLTVLTDLRCFCLSSPRIRHNPKKTINCVRSTVLDEIEGIFQRVMFNFTSYLIPSIVRIFEETFVSSLDSTFFKIVFLCRTFQTSLQASSLFLQPSFHVSVILGIKSIAFWRPCMVPSSVAELPKRF